MWLLRFNLYRTYLLGISLCLPGTGLSDELLLLEAVEYNNVHIAEAPVSYTHLTLPTICSV